MSHKLKYNKSFNYLLLILVVVAVNFLLPRLLPGNPLAFLVGEEVGYLSSQEKQMIISKYGLDKPLYIQFLTYIKNILTLDFGISYSKKQPIVDIIKGALPWTLLLSISNLIVSSILGCFLGALSALKKKDKDDMKMTLIISIISSIPAFWIGMIFISIFSVKFNFFPVYGAYTFWQDYKGIQKVIDVGKHLFLPLTTMVIVSISRFFIPMRCAVIDVMSEDYVFMAKARGLPTSYINYKYIIRNSLLPVFTVFMIDIGYILSGSIVIETVFSYPGIGRTMYEAVLSRDYPVMQCTFLAISIMVIFANYLADKLYPVLDPGVMKNIEN